MTRVKNANLPVSPSCVLAAHAQAHLKRIVDDTERRLNILFDGLNNETVPKHAIDQMNQISKGMSVLR